MDLVDIHPHIPDAIIDIRYATTNNITGEVLYKSSRPRLNNVAADKLVSAAAVLRRKHRYLVIWDAYRSEEAQSKLRAVNNDERYVSIVSKHSQGLAIDLTLADNAGRYLDMGTDFDDFTPRAHSDADNLTKTQHANRRLLAQTMIDAGFEQWPYEWWHFECII